MDTKALRQKIADLAIRGNLFHKIRMMSRHRFCWRKFVNRSKKMFKEGKLKEEERTIPYL